MYNMLDISTLIEVSAFIFFKPIETDDNLRIYKGSDSDVMVMGAVGKNYSAKVYDYSGRLIKEVNFNHKTKISDLDSKMKILRIESEEGVTIKKFKLN